MNMMRQSSENGLFRKEVLQKNNTKSFGQVLLKQPSEYQWVSFAMFFVVVAVLVFLFLGSYTKYSDVFGMITVDKGLVKVSALREGQIIEQVVKQGDKVSQGDLLYVISTVRHSSMNQNIDENILNQQQQLQQSLQRDLVINEQRHALDLQLIKEKIAAKKREITQLNAQLDIDKQRMALSELRLERNRELFTAGHLNQAQLDLIIADNLDQKSRYNDLQSRFDSLNFALNELNNELEIKPGSFLESQNRLKRSLIENEQRIVEVSSNIDYRIYAPVSGTIGTQLTHIGEYVSKGSVLASLIPEDSTLQAELYVPTHAIGFIKPEQDVSMRYSAFPYQHFGLQQGKVSSVSKVISLPNELETSVDLQGAVYKVIVDLEKQFVEAKGDKLSLGVGMELEASIQLENRTLVQWLLEPIYSLRNK
ncbi:Colicin V secretion protein CvaA [Thalassocella blandensis]|nr:Colicin V secretion protein CvaA [Thalassocella blandensis]